MIDSEDAEQQIIYTEHYTFSGVTKNKIEIYIPKIKQTNKNEKNIPKSKSFSCRDESRLSILSCLSISWWILMVSLCSPDKQQSPILNSLKLLQDFAVNTFINHWGVKNLSSRKPIETRLPQD